MNINNLTHHIDGAHIYHEAGIIPQLLLAIPFMLVLVIYIFAVIVSNLRYKQWPAYRTTFAILGVISATASVVSPLADSCTHGFYSEYAWLFCFWNACATPYRSGLLHDAFLRTLNVGTAHV